jgi:N-acyl-D-amino-acid deacylase
MHDLVIRGAEVIDGTGAPGRVADVAVRAGRIAGIGGDLGETRRVLDAHGQVLTPGFIDIHSHSDFTLPLNPRAESKVRQGVTTEVLGNCGFSVAPALRGRAPALQQYLGASAPWLPFGETTFAAYLDTYPATAVNAVFQVGHHTLRLMTVGMEDRPPTPGELRAMETQLAEALDAGAFGLSSGLFTTPGSFAAADEIHALGRVLRRHGAAYAAHVRNEASRLFDAVAEALAVAETCDVHVQLGHLKLAGVDSWGQAARILEAIDAARGRGLRIDADQYPYTTATNPLRNLFPNWTHEGGVTAMLERLGDRTARRRIGEELAAVGCGSFGRLPSWDAVRIAVSPHAPAWAGRTIGELARTRAVDPLDMACDVLRDDRGQTRVLIDCMAEADVREILRWPATLIGSDGIAVAPTGTTGQGKPHPRYYGTFPRVLGHYVRDLGLLGLPDAVRKMTGGAAAVLGLAERGLVREGWHADLTVFDPRRIAEQGTYEDPHRFPVGISTVLVNGVPVVDGCEHTGALPGRVLRRGPRGVR